MQNEAVITLRNRLAAFVEAQGSATPTRDIVAAFREAHAAEIDAAASSLFDLALTKLVDEVSRRRKGSDPAQGDLFRGASMPRAIVVEVFHGGRVKRARKPFTSVTFAEAEGYLTRKLPERKPRQDRGVQAILERIRPHMTSPDQTIAEGIAAADAAEREAAETA